MHHRLLSYYCVGFLLDLVSLNLVGSAPSSLVFNFNNVYAAKLIMEDPYLISFMRLLFSCLDKGWGGKGIEVVNFVSF